MKRWSFRGFGQTHGTHEYRRHPGAIGQRKTPGRVYPNKKMPGHYGVEQVTTQNLTVVDVDRREEPAPGQGRASPATTTASSSCGRR